MSRSARQLPAVWPCGPSHFLLRFHLQAEAGWSEAAEARRETERRGAELEGCIQQLQQLLAVTGAAVEAGAARE